MPVTFYCTVLVSIKVLLLVGVKKNWVKKLLNNGLENDSLDLIKESLVFMVVAVDEN